MTPIATVYATFPSEEEARRIARILIEERLAACANILGPCHSLYRWHGAVEEGEEVAALFKTRSERSEALIARLSELHSYEVPAAVVWPIADASAGYADWVRCETAPDRHPGESRDP
ncbi:MAG: periplasmic divalent cation tolerance protein [Sphingomonadales bacterium]|jgi:periplasmic divalent cation tolerance protein|nr:periplasmic divalent cation tolerance protein [Sphingomonadales bacterium]